jgi:hypothetical protein
MVFYLGSRPTRAYCQPQTGQKRQKEEKEKEEEKR